ncbi:MAG: glucuronate isomerase, partial [Caulobacteraceae bacterium]|nr:glucuronate isomerase [Caulobacter sp.]
MPRPLSLHPDRLFPADPGARAIARELHARVARLPIVSPHGHADPRWFADNAPFSNAAELLVAPDHYLFRMLRSQGVDLASLGVPDAEGRVGADPREAWRVFASHAHLFRATPSALWLDTVFAEVFGFEVRLDATTADFYFDRIGEALAQPAFRPRALFERFGIEVLATTDAAQDPLEAHRAIRASGWGGRVIPTYRPDAAVDPEAPGFAAAIDALGALTGEDVDSWSGYLAAHRGRRTVFRELGATATDHGHPTAATADLAPREAEALFARVRRPSPTPQDAELFRAQMLTEMARMSVDDGMVMQLHPGVFRSHDTRLLRRFGRDKGADIPVAAEYVHALRPLLNRFGDAPGFTLVVFTLDESTYARELAPLAGVYPALKLGPAWWFNDSPEGIRRFREQTTETAGFYNTVGFNDDTRAFLS